MQRRGSGVASRSCDQWHRNAVLSWCEHRESTSQSTRCPGNDADHNQDGWIASNNKVAVAAANLTDIRL